MGGAADDAVAIEVVLHPNPYVASAMREALIGVEGIRLLQPLSYRDLVRKMGDVDLILSDSGGIQEEAPALGTPLLILRDKTERPEAIGTGNMRLVGTDRARIVSEVRGLRCDPLALERMARPAFPYGDGHAGERIAAIVDDWLANQDQNRVVNQ